MTTAFASYLALTKDPRTVRFAAVLFMLVIGGLAAFPVSYLSGTNFLVGLVILPFVLITDGKARFHILYYGIAALLAALAWAYDVKAFYFLSLAFAFVALVEVFFGSVNPLVFCLVAAMSPVFQQLVGILGFPIRLALSNAAGKILRTAGLDVSIDGNMITLAGNAFTVDDACMGLNMLAIAMLLSVFVLATELKRQRKNLTLFYVCLFFVTVFVLNIGANLFRIVALVLFRVGPENAMHEPLGIASLLVYCIFPAAFLARSIVRWKGRSINKDAVHVVESRALVIASIVVVTVMSVGFTIDPNREARMTHHVEVSGMQAVSMRDGMSKFSNDNFLIYVKAIPEFFSGEHTPLFCWQGSGYTFEKISTTIVGKNIVYTGILVKGSDRLHTAWWYSNGKVNTIDQFAWRYTSLKTGESFCLVNVTTATPNQLLDKVKRLLDGELSIQSEHSVCL